MPESGVEPFVLRGSQARATEDAGGFEAAGHEALKRLEALKQRQKGTEMATPGLKRKVISYCGALKRWMAAGRPSRTDEEVQQIYQGLCEPCEHFDEDKRSCKVCGCRLRPDEAAFANKIRMATEHCPKRKW